MNRLDVFVGLLCVAFVPGARAQLWEKHTIVKSAAANGSINSAVSSDYNADGLPDVLSSYGGAVRLLLSPAWTPRTVHVFSRQDSASVKLRGACIHSCLMDVDGDGDKDFIGSNQTVFWLECPANPVTERWTFRTIDDEIRGTHCVLAGDVNQDGKLDLIANSFRGSDATSVPESIVWLESPNKPKTKAEWTRHVFADSDAPGGSHYMGLGDLNGDGRYDIACGAKGGPGFEGGQWFAWWEQPEGDPDQPWNKHLISAGEPGATNIHPVDLNADGHMDLLATRGHGHGVLLFKGPQFDRFVIDDEIAGPHCLVTVDLDSDGDVDAATCGHQTDGIAVWYENDGAAQFTRHVIGKQQSAYDIRAVDLDGDSDLDLLIAGHFSKNIVWYENPLR